MKICELARRKKTPVPYDPVEAARDMLEYYKEQGCRLKPNGTQQLFVPRKVERYFTKKERFDKSLKDAYAYDENGNLTDSYKQWIDNATESKNVFEGAPVLTNTTPKPGGSKPLDAAIWTSTAIKLPNGKYTSDWHNYVLKGGLGSSCMKDQSKIGYLYNVKPNTTVYEIDSTNDAKIIYELFNDLGRENTAWRDKEEWEKVKSYAGNPHYLIQKDFPWQYLSAHFDAIHHNGCIF